MREIKLIWDDRDADNLGWFAREYTENVIDSETGETETSDNEWTFDAAQDADSEALIEAAGIVEDAEVEIYNSINDSQARETVSV